MVANSIKRAVGFEQERSAAQLEIARLKLEKFPKREAAMKYFGKHASQYFKGHNIIKAAKVLKSEDNASFFLLLEGEHKRDWSREEAKVSDMVK